MHFVDDPVMEGALYEQIGAMSTEAFESQFEKRAQFFCTITEHLKKVFHILYRWSHLIEAQLRRVMR